VIPGYHVGVGGVKRKRNGAAVVSKRAARSELTARLFLRFYPPQDGNGAAAQSIEELCKDRVILSTMHGAKGMEFERGYILTLSKRHMPDSREPDIDAERRLLNVAITRFRKQLVRGRTCAVRARACIECVASLLAS
jgi:superfamily I DNA/RNA helicase